MSNSIIDTIILLIVSNVRFVLVFSMTRFKQLFKFGSNILLGGIVGFTYEQIRPLIIGFKFSTVDLAFYNKGMQYPLLINSIINDTLAAVLFPVMSKAQDDSIVVVAMTRQFMRVCSYVIFPVMLGLTVISENLVVILLTEKWIPIVPYVKIFSVAYMFTILQSCNLLPIKAIGRSDVLLKVDIIKKIIYFLILIVFVLFSKKPHALAEMGIIVGFIAYSINSFVGQKYIHYKIKQQLIDVFENLIPATIMYILVLFTNLFPIVPIILLPIQILTGIFTYCILSFYLKNESFFYLLNIILSKIHCRYKDF